MLNKLLTYDLVPPGQDYDTVWKVVADLYGGTRIQQSVWLLQTMDTETQIAQRLTSAGLDVNDRLTIVSYDPATAHISPPANAPWWRGSLFGPGTGLTGASNALSAREQIANALMGKTWGR